VAAALAVITSLAPAAGTERRPPTELAGTARRRVGIDPWARLSRDRIHVVLSVIDSAAGAAAPSPHFRNLPIMPALAIRAR